MRWILHGKKGTKKLWLKVIGHNYREEGHLKKIWLSSFTGSSSLLGLSGPSSFLCDIVQYFILIEYTRLEKDNGHFEHNGDHIKNKVMLT